VNVPASKKEAIAGIQFTSLSHRRYHKPVVEKIDPRGCSYFWIAGERESWARKTPSDHHAVEKNMVSVTPLHLDLTDYDALKRLKNWGRSLSPDKSTSVSSTQKVTKVKSRRTKT
jgi:5'-nucleotidase